MVQCRELPGGEWRIIEQALSPKVTLYFDSKVQPGLSYAYRVAAGFGSRLSGWSEVVQCTPKLDPVVPEGILRVRSQDGTVPGHEVTLLIEASVDAVAMRIANDTAALHDAAWMPLVPSLEWKLDAGVPVGGLATVFAEFLDAAGNEGHALPVMVRIVPRQSYTSWIAGYVSTDDPAFKTKSDPETDLDGDGFNNWSEFAAGGDPLKPGSPGAVVSAMPAGGGVVFCHRRRANEGDSIRAVIEWSTDLVTWLPAPNGWKLSEPTVSPLGDGVERVCVEAVPIDLKSTAVFYRVRWVAAP